MIVSSPRDFRELARRRLPRFLFDYIDGGAGDESTLARNVDDLASLAIRQRVLAGSEAVSLTTKIFGELLQLPVVLAPVGLTGMYARRGEVQAAQAARAAGIPFCLSTVSVCPIDEVVRESGAPCWFQLYMLRDRGFMRELLSQAWGNGCRTLVFTVDMPVPGARYRDAHSAMSGPHAALRRYAQAVCHPRWSFDVGLRGRPHTLGNVAPVLGRSSGLEDFMGWLGANFDPGIRWSDLDWIRAAWDGHLVIKGIMDVDDARSAVSLGADGIVISNHGGRQLDGAPSTVAMLPVIAAAVKGELAIMADSGVRTGTDIFRMLALGADAVMLGRSYIYALAASGRVGVERLLRIMENELRIAMILSGNHSLENFENSLMN